MKRFQIQEYAVWVGFLVLAALVLVTLFSLGSLSGNGREDQRAYVQRAVENAAVQCYALEGAYPPDVEYLEEHYGVKYDKEQFYVHYRVEGGNLRPDIEVFFSRGNPIG